MSDSGRSRPMPSGKGIRLKSTGRPEIKVGDINRKSRGRFLLSCQLITCFYPNKQSVEIVLVSTSMTGKLCQCVVTSISDLKACITKNAA